MVCTLKNRKPYDGKKNCLTSQKTFKRQEQLNSIFGKKQGKKFGERGIFSLVCY
jgi:hypothetical protein